MRCLTIVLDILAMVDVDTPIVMAADIIDDTLEDTGDITDGNLSF